MRRLHSSLLMVAGVLALVVFVDPGGYVRAATSRMSDLVVSNVQFSDGTYGMKVVLTGEDGNPGGGDASAANQTALNALVGNVDADPTANTVLGRLKSLEDLFTNFTPPGVSEGAALTTPTLTIFGARECDAVASAAGVVDGDGSALCMKDGQLYVRAVNYTSGGTEIGQPLCLDHTKITPFNIDISADTSMIAADGSEVIYICSLELITTGAEEVTAVFGTTSSTPCDTSADTQGTWNFNADGDGKVSMGGGQVILKGAAGDAFCLMVSAGGVNITGSGTYVQQ